MPESIGPVSRQNGNLVNNPNYQVIIRREASGQYPGVTIRANLPESFSFGVTASYDQRLPSDLSRFPGAEQAGVFFNVSRVFQEFSHQVWTNTSPIQFSLPLLFDAVSTGEDDVIDPIRHLMAMTLPYKENPEDNLLKSPGPTLKNPNLGRVSMRIGNMCYFHSVLINDVQPAFDTRMTITGAPISASCDVSVTTVNTPSRDDIDLFFLTANRDRNISQEERERYGTAYRYDSLSEIAVAAAVESVNVFESSVSVAQQGVNIVVQGAQDAQDALNSLGDISPNGITTSLGLSSPNPDEVSNLN